MPRPGTRKSPAELALVAALAAGQTFTEAAASAGLSRRTVARRAADPTVQRAVSAARADMLGRALGALADACADAIKALRDNLRNATEDSERRLAAASILQHAVRFREHVELAHRLDEVAAMVEGMHGATAPTNGTNGPQAHDGATTRQEAPR